MCGVQFFNTIFINPDISGVKIYICLFSDMFSVRVQKKRGPRPDRSPIGV